VAQDQLAAWFQLPQPDISRWEHYWLAGDWANLLSWHTAEPLTHELRARIVTVGVTFPWWGAVELVIRRFDQHYQDFCGFDNIASPRWFLGVFEKGYRFTPFSQDAQPCIRGKCPLELAGYDIGQMPMAALCAGSSFAWPLEPPPAEVPKQCRSPTVVAMWPGSMV